MVPEQLTVATLRKMADTMSDLEFSDAELELCLPYVQRYLKSMATLASLDFSSFTPDALDPSWYLKE